MKNFILLLSIVFIITMGCSSKENNYNRMLDWMNQIPKGMNMDAVKKSQPDFVIVNWEKPDTLLGYLRIEVKPKNYYDILQMANYLTFDSVGYRGRKYQK